MNYVEYVRNFVGKNPIILVGAVVIIINELNQILLQQRKATSYGSWGLPGGLMELKESTEEAARREVFEETGLRINRLHLEEVVSGEHCYLKVPNGDEFYSVTVVYSTRDVKGIAEVNDNESLNIAYYSFDELPKDIVGSHRKMIDNYLMKMESNKRKDNVENIIY